VRKRSVFTCREKELKAFAWLDVCESVCMGCAMCAGGGGGGAASSPVKKEKKV
jgi:hypothetical protein